METEEKRISITDLSELLNVHINTLRQWEKQFGIVVPRSKDSQRSRYYTENEINVFTKIRDMRNENISIDNIKRVLNKDIDVMEQEEQAMAVMPFSELNMEDIKDMLLSTVKDELKKEFEGVLKEQLQQQKEELQEQFKRDLENQSEMQSVKLETKIREQISSENQKLIDYIAATREEDKKKGFFSKLFRK